MDQPCGETAAHEFHSHEKTITTTCSGKTRCGASDHPAHDFPEARQFWCGGICDCGMSGYGSHGPGAHK